MLNLGLPALIALARSFVDNLPIGGTTVGDALDLGIDLVKFGDRMIETINNSPDAAAADLAEANALVAQLQAVRDAALTDLGQKAPNS